MLNLQVCRCFKQCGGAIGKLSLTVPGAESRRVRRVVQSGHTVHSGGSERTKACTRDTRNS